eukprot:4717992-Ditylum_brightwellii.AAC.1
MCGARPCSTTYSLNRKSCSSRRGRDSETGRCCPSLRGDPGRSEATARGGEGAADAGGGRAARGREAG